ncbi:MAG: hypothetical protein ACE5PT_05695 [Gemmatimonadales bacterium]
MSALEVNAPLMALALIPVLHPGGSGLAAQEPLPEAVDGHVVTQRVTAEDGTVRGTLTIRIAQGHVRLEMEGLGFENMDPDFRSGMYVLIRRNDRPRVVIPSERGVRDFGELFT